MIRSISKYKKWFGYILYGILLMIVLLYYRFPSDAVGDYLQSTADEINPSYTVLIGKVRPLLPVGVKLLRTRVSLRENPDTNLLTAETLLIKPRLWSFLKGESKYGVNCFAYGGDIKGTVHFSEDGGEATDRPFTTSLELRDLRINDYEYLFKIIGRNVKGILGGNITYSGQSNLLINGTGEASLRISDGSVELLQPVFSLKSVGFDDLWIKMILDKTKIKLTRVEMGGKEIKGTLSGTIGLKQNFSKSRLALRGSIEPLAGFFKSENGAPRMMTLFKRRLRKGKLSFVVRGTPADPKIRFI
jgi:type II secretion system protein N